MSPSYFSFGLQEEAFYRGQFVIWSRVLIIAFDEVERKPNFDQWLSRGGCPVHGYMLEKSHSCKDTKMATPLEFCRGMSRPVSWCRYQDM